MIDGGLITMDGAMLVGVTLTGGGGGGKTGNSDFEPSFSGAINFGPGIGEMARQGLSYVQYGASAGRVEQALKTGKYIHRGRVYWQGNYPKVTQAMNNSLSGAKFTKNLGRGMTGVNAGIAVYDFLGSDRLGADVARLTGSIILMGTAAIPVVGPFISIGLGIADSFGAFDSIYNQFD